MRQAVGRDPGIFQRLPGDFQQQALLRVEPQRFARRDAEEIGVKTRDVVQKTAAADVHPSRCVRIGIVVPLLGPSVTRNRHNRIASLAEQFQECLRRIGAAGKAATDAHDGDVAAGGWGGGCGSQPGIFGAQRPDGAQRVLQQLAL